MLSFEETLEAVCLLMYVVGIPLVLGALILGSEVDECKPSEIKATAPVSRENVSLPRHRGAGRQLN